MRDVTPGILHIGLIKIDAQESYTRAVYFWILLGKVVARDGIEPPTRGFSNF